MVLLILGKDAFFVLNFIIFFVFYIVFKVLILNCLVGIFNIHSGYFHIISQSFAMCLWCKLTSDKFENKVSALATHLERHKRWPSVIDTVNVCVSHLHGVLRRSS